MTYELTFMALLIVGIFWLILVLWYVYRVVKDRRTDWDKVAAKRNVRRIYAHDDSTDEVDDDPWGDLGDIAGALDDEDYEDYTGRKRR